MSMSFHPREDYYLIFVTYFPLIFFLINNRIITYQGKKIRIIKKNKKKKSNKFGRRYKSKKRQRERQRKTIKDSKRDSKTNDGKPRRKNDDIEKRRYRKTTTEKTTTGKRRRENDGSTRTRTRTYTMEGPFDHYYDHLNEGTLQILQRTSDDIFTGASSKQIFYRAPGQQHLRFDFHSEIYIYINFMVKQYLESLLSQGQSYFVWLAVLLEFSQISQPTDIARRWSSFRNAV